MQKQRQVPIDETKCVFFMNLAWQWNVAFCQDEFCSYPHWPLPLRVISTWNVKFSNIFLEKRDNKKVLNIELLPLPLPQDNLVIFPLIRTTFFSQQDVNMWVRWKRDNVKWPLKDEVAYLLHCTCWWSPVTSPSDPLGTWHPSISTNWFSTHVDYSWYPQ